MLLDRTHRCGELNKSIVGQIVILSGWVETRRDHGGVIFVDIRDNTGKSQVVFDQADISMDLPEKIRNEFVISIKGKVVLRSNETINPNLSTGEVEVFAESMEILNECDTLPFQINDDTEVAEKLRLTYRFLDLRRPSLNKNFILRSKTYGIIRDFLSHEGFLEIETPVLTKSTPEGARDYLVPSRVQQGKFFALPQSPQLFKQLLMVAGMDRYFQIVKCFRDEDLRGNRQPEFTQIDLEISFPTINKIIDICSRMVGRIFNETIGVSVPSNIQRMTYDYAMEHYGTDAPDIRYDLKMINLTQVLNESGFQVFDSAIKSEGIVKCIVIPGGAQLSRKEIDELTELAKIYKAKGMAWIKVIDEEWQSPILKFLKESSLENLKSKTSAKSGDLILFGADKPNIVNDALSAVRKEVAKRMGFIRNDQFEFVWITDFPLFDYDEEEKRFIACHHPFTSPNTEDFEKFANSDPLKIRAQAYDLVLNGVEIGGGSIRIHNSSLQHKVFELLKLNEDEIQDKFGFLIDAMRFGAPPHGGLAFGLDRIMMFLCGTESIRDVIAFPKTQQATCLMTSAPSSVDNLQLKQLGIAIRKDLTNN